MGKFIDTLEKSEISFPWKYRILLGASSVLVVVGLILGSYFNDGYKNTGDTNIYLGEEACFADEIYVKVNSINVMSEENDAQNIDEDGDLLSSYTLNLGIAVEQRNKDFWVNKVTVSPSCFKLKSVNLKARSKMAVFFECLAKETLAVMIGGAVDGSINIIEETINYAADYTLASIENAQNNTVDFKPIKCVKDSFESFAPRKVKGQTFVNLSFPIKKEYLESENLIVLAIDDLAHYEKRIFLITRPETIVQDK